ncbi:MAG: hypothetical protein ABEH65_13300 [Halobacteriales archaeon]
MTDIDSETLFNGAAAAVATIAVLFFIVNVEVGYSPVSKVLLVIAFLTGIFALTQRSNDAQLTLFGYGVIVISGVGLFIEIINISDLGNSLTVFGLLAIAGILFIVRTLLDETNRFVSGTQATYAFGTVSIVAIVILIVDITSGGIAYELQPAAEIEYTGGHENEIVIGQITAVNPTPLPEEVETPAFEACTAGNWSQYRPQTADNDPKGPVEIHAHVEDGYNEYVFGFGRKSYPIVLHLGGTSLEGETFPVRVTEQCPSTETGPAYIALYERTNDRTVRAV